MIFDTVWTTLGIEETDDTTAIRRAYARRLKATNPEDDAAGFEALRNAYETALAHASWRRAPDDVAAPVSPEAQTTSSAAVALAPRPVEADRDAEEAAALQHRLVEIARDPDRPEADLADAFGALLNSSSQQSVRVFAETERWAADFIGGNIPRTDVLVERAIDHYGWNRPSLGGRAPVGAGVLARDSDLRFLATARVPGSEINRGYRALSRPPSFLAAVGNRLWPFRPPEVRKLLNLIRSQRPGLEGDLDARAVAWWDKHFSKPRIPASAILLLLAAAGMALIGLSDWSLGAPLTNESVATAGILAAVSALLLGRHFLVDLPRMALADHLGWDAPIWRRLGWAPALVAIMAAAAVAPASAVTATLLGLLTVGALLWALIAAEPDRRPGEGTSWAAWDYMSILTIGFWMTQWLWRPCMRYPWQLRALFAFAYVAIFWAVIRQDMHDPIWWQMTLPVACASLGFGAGAGTLVDLWSYEIDRRGRLAAMGVMAALAVAGGSLLWLGAAQPPLLALGAALVMTAVFLHKPAAEGFDPGLAVGRDLIMRLGWLFWLAVSTLLAPDPGDPLFLRVGAMWLLAGVAITIIGALQREFGRRVELAY